MLIDLGIGFTRLQQQQQQKDFIQTQHVLFPPEIATKLREAEGGKTILPEWYEEFEKHD